MDVSLEEVLWQYLDASIHGHEIIEITWRDGTGRYSRKSMIETLRVIPSSLYTLVVDAFGRFLGIIGRIPGKLPVQWQGPILFPLEDLPGFVPAWKLALFTHDPKPGSPQGTSRLEGAYNAYTLKKRNWAEFLQYLVRYASVTPIGICGPNSVASDPNKSPEQELAETLSQLDNLAALGLPWGSTVEFAQLPKGTQPFLDTIAGCNREIAMTILGHSRSTNESQFASKADSQTAQDGVDEDTQFSIEGVLAGLTRQVIRPLIEENFGPGHPVPILTARKDEDRFATEGPVIADLYRSRAVAPNQEAEYAERLGVSAPIWPEAKPQNVPMTDDQKKAMSERL